MTITRMRFVLTSDGDSVHYIDLAREISKCQRRFASQFQNFTVMGGILKDSNQDAVARFNVAPDTWVTRTALKRGKRMFDKMINQRKKEFGAQVVMPKYHDFKVGLNSDATHTNLEACVDASGREVPSGEWIYPLYVSEDVDWTVVNTSANRNADEFTAHICGAHSTGTGGNHDTWAGVGLIKSWIDTRPEPNNEPDTMNVPALLADPLLNLFDETDADDEVITNLTVHNDEPPYAKGSAWGEAFGPVTGVGENLQRVAVAACQQGAGQISAINGFNAICGLVQVHVTGGGPGTVELLLDVKTKGGSI